jgi:hypothetical protein
MVDVEIGRHEKAPAGEGAGAILREQGSSPPTTSAGGLPAHARRLRARRAFWALTLGAMMGQGRFASREDCEETPAQLCRKRIEL